MNLLSFIPPSQALNRKAALLDLQRGESFMIRIKAALETLWSTYLLFSAYKKNISGDLPSLYKIPLYRHLFLREDVQAFSRCCTLSSPRLVFTCQYFLDFIGRLSSESSCSIATSLRLHVERNQRDRYTIVPAPLGIEPNTSKHGSTLGKDVARERRPLRTL